MSRVLGDIPLLVQEMLSSFRKWEDEICLRQHGFRYSELQRTEEALARCYVSAEMGSEDAARELKRLADEYKMVWLPRRWKLEKGS